MTGTSNSVTEAWDKLRIAGAQARTMLIAAAARAWRVDPAECHVKDGMVANAHGNTFTYGEWRPLPPPCRCPKRSRSSPKPISA